MEHESGKSKDSSTSFKMNFTVKTIFALMALKAIEANDIAIPTLTLQQVPNQVEIGLKGIICYLDKNPECEPPQPVPRPSQSEGNSENQSNQEGSTFSDEQQRGQAETDENNTSTSNEEKSNIPPPPPPPQWNLKKMAGKAEEASEILKSQTEVKKKLSHSKNKPK